MALRRKVGTDFLGTNFSIRIRINLLKKFGPEPSASEKPLAMGAGGFFLEDFITFLLIGGGGEGVFLTAMSSMLPAAVANKATATTETPLFGILIIILNLFMHGNVMIVCKDFIFCERLMCLLFCYVA